jgi:hypothetical protein
MYFADKNKVNSIHLSKKNCIRYSISKYSISALAVTDIYINSSQLKLPPFQKSGV